MAGRGGRTARSFGSWRGGCSGGPLAQNQGSRVYGQANSGAGIFPQGSGPVDSGAGWHPTVIYLLVFVAVEVGAFGLLGRGLGGGTGTGPKRGAAQGAPGVRATCQLPCAPSARGERVHPQRSAPA